MNDKSKAEALVSRVLDILIRLCNNEHLSKNELANQYEVSPRTIQRDILERLKDLDIRKDKDGKYFLKNTRFIKNPKKDFKKLADACSIDMELNDELIELLLETSKIIINFQNYKGEYDFELFKKLIKAILNNKIIKIIYNSNPRTLKPYRLNNHLGVWYLIAEYEGELRTFTLYKIKSLMVKKESFIPNKKILKMIEENKSFFPSNECKEAVLEINDFAVEFFMKRRMIKDYEIIEKKENKLIILARYSFDNELLCTVWNFIPYIKILSPDYLVKKNKELIKEYLEKL